MKSLNNFKELIYTIRGIKVMLDADLAEIYGYTTSAFNQQVKNNIEKFDDDFRFQLTKEEYQEIMKSKISCIEFNTSTNYYDSTNRDKAAGLMSKNFTSKRGGTRKIPFVFTEQGIYMLMTVLKGELATKQSKALIRTFKEMKDFIIDNHNFLGDRELLQLAIQNSKNTSDIAEIKETMVTKNELTKVIHNFTNPDIRQEYLILNGSKVEANLAYKSIYETAKNSIFVIDNYIGIKTLVLLKNTKSDVTITFFTDNIGQYLHHYEYEDFCKEYPDVTITFRRTCGIYHDRYIILDYNSNFEKIYHCGASSKDAGNKITTISEVTDRQIYHPIVDRLLNNPLLTFK